MQARTIRGGWAPQLRIPVRALLFLLIIPSALLGQEPESPADLSRLMRQLEVAEPAALLDWPLLNARAHLLEQIERGQLAPRQQMAAQALLQQLEERLATAPGQGPIGAVRTRLETRLESARAIAVGLEQLERSAYDADTEERLQAFHQALDRLLGQLRELGRALRLHGATTGEEQALRAAERTVQQLERARTLRGGPMRTAVSRAAELLPMVSQPLLAEHRQWQRRHHTEQLEELRSRLAQVLGSQRKLLSAIAASSGERRWSIIQGLLSDEMTRSGELLEHEEARIAAFMVELLVRDMERLLEMLSEPDGAARQKLGSEVLRQLEALIGVIDRELADRER